jgi:lysophospholipase L1-like esterase
MYKFFFLLILPFLLSCTKSEIAIKSTDKNTPLRYLALGDSYTIGESVSEEERWPVKLIDHLNQEGFNFEAPRIIATTGWTTGELIDAINKENPESYDLVSLLIGVNNQYRGMDINVYEKEFTQLLQKSLELAGKDTSRVFVASIPDYSVTPFGQSKDPQKIFREIDAFNKINKAVTERMGVAYFNITPISRNAINDSDLLANDSLHPSGKMYQEWVDMIFPVIKNLLKQKK